MAIKIPLKMPDGTSVRTIEELRDHFDFTAVFDYYSTGRLKKWLEDRYYDEEAEKVEDLDPISDDFKKDLCDILGLPYSDREAEQLDLDDIVKRNERCKLLRNYTADDKILALIDSVAFNQEELDNLLKENIPLIYLCGENFIISEGVEGITYIGVNNPVINFEGKRIKPNIDVENVEININSYIDIKGYIDSYIDIVVHNVMYSDEDDMREITKYKFCSFFCNNSQLGIKLLRMAVEKGCVTAQMQLSVCYLIGFGVEENLEECMELLQNVAERGYAEAQCLLGMCYEYINGDEENEEEAVKWYLKAAEQGYAEAQCLLGMCYYNGLGVEENKEEAVKWYLKAAKQGYAEAQCFLGMCYYNGLGVEENEEEAVKWYLKAAKQGYAEAQHNLGICYDLEEDAEKAIKWYLKAAKQGFVEAQYELGVHYEDGEGVQKNKKEAEKWYLKAARKGHAEAQYSLGIHYEYGNGVEKNEEEAIKWYQKAAEQGHMQAEIMLKIHERV